MPSPTVFQSFRRARDRINQKLVCELNGRGLEYFYDPARLLLDMVSAAVDKILGGGYRDRAVELRNEATSFGTLDVLEREIWSLVD